MCWPVTRAASRLFRCPSPSLHFAFKTSKVHVGEGALKLDLLRIKKWEAMTAANWLFFPVSLTLDFPPLHGSNLNRAVIAYIAFLPTPFLQWNLISLLSPAVEFSAAWCRRNNAKWCVKQKKKKEERAKWLLSCFSVRGVRRSVQNVTAHHFEAHPRLVKWSNFYEILFYFSQNGLNVGSSFISLL